MPSPRDIDLSVLFYGPLFHLDLLLMYL